MSTILGVKPIIKLAHKHGTEPFCPRDEALIALSGLAYFSANELSLVNVRDLITERRGIVVDGYLPSELNSNGFSRYFFIGKNTYLRKVLEQHIQWLKDNNFSGLDRELYCGLNPDARLFVKDDGSNFEVNFKNRYEGDAITQPLQMQRHFKKFLLGQEVSITTLTDSFIVNFWSVKSLQGSAQAIRDLIEMTGLTADTLRRKCIRKQESIKDVLTNLYKTKG